MSRFGRLDLLVNNAGVTSPTRRPVDELSPEEWRRVHAVNLDGTFFGIQAALRVMKGSPRGGSIVNIDSISSFTSIENHEAYSTSKSAVRGLTRHAALSCAKLGYRVRVNAVHPGVVWTPLFAQKWSERFGSEEKAREYQRSLTPSGDAVETSDIASAVAFLGSDDARMVTGSELVVDAGATLEFG
ncbi:MAG: SDR family oxidoreductase [Rubrivivax sp.]|nr:SDR family oxidoreductase [Rubrivivax sp.]